MFRVTIFSGYHGRLQPGKAFYLTLFGAFELTHPTLAQQWLLWKQSRDHPQPRLRKPFFLTIFGAGCIKSPTLAEEYLDLRQAMNGGLLSPEGLTGVMTTFSVDPGIATLTLFGVVNENRLPNEDEEIDSLAVQQHLGNIPERASRILQCGIGQSGPERRATLQRAIDSTFEPPP